METKAIIRKAKHRVNGKSSSSYTKGDKLFYACILALPILQTLIFYFYVNFNSFALAFQSYDTVSNKYSWGLDANINDFKLIKDTIGMWALNSVLVWIVTSLVGTTIAVIFSYYIYRRRTMSSIFKFILFLPSVVPAILLGMMFKNFMQAGLPTYSNGAIVNTMDSISLASMFGEKGATQVRFWLLTAYSVWISFGSQVLIYTGAMDQIPTEVVEAGRLDGTSFMGELRHIVFPSILGSVGTFLVSGVAGLFTNQNNLFNIIGMNSNVLEGEQTVGYFLYTYLLKHPGGSGYTFVSFLGLICTCIVVPISLGVRKLVERAYK